MGPSWNSQSSAKASTMSRYHSSVGVRDLVMAKLCCALSGKPVISVMMTKFSANMTLYYSQYLPGMFQTTLYSLTYQYLVTKQFTLRAGNVIAESITRPPFPTRRFPVSVDLANHPLVTQAKMGDTLTVTLSKEVCGTLTVRDFTLTIVHKN